MPNCNKNETVSTIQHSEMIKALTSDVASVAYKNNKGYSLDIAKNGKPSKQFKFLLDTPQINGDRLKAMRIMALVLSPEYIRRTPNIKYDDNGQPILSNEGFIPSVKTEVSINDLESIKHRVSNNDILGNLKEAIKNVPGLKPNINKEVLESNINKLKLKYPAIRNYRFIITAKDHRMSDIVDYAITDINYPRISFAEDLAVLDDGTIIPDTTSSELKDNIIEYYNNKANKIIKDNRNKDFKDYIKQVYNINHIRLDMYKEQLYSNNNRQLTQREIEANGVVKSKDYFKEILIEDLRLRINTYYKLLVKHNNTDKGKVLRHYIKNIEELQQLLKNNDTIYDEALLELSAELGYSQKDKTDDLSIEVQDDEGIALAKLFDKHNNTVSRNLTINDRIKELLYGLHKYELNELGVKVKVRNPNTGIFELGSVETNLNILKEALFSSFTGDAILSKLNDIVDIEPQFEKLINILVKDRAATGGELLNMFSSNFTMTKRSVTQHLITTNSKGTTHSLTTTNNIPKLKLANNILSELSVLISNNYFTKDKIQELKDKVAIINKAVGKVNKAFALYDLLNNSLHIPISPEIIIRESNNKSVDDLYNLKDFLNTIVQLSNKDLTSLSKDTTLGTSPKKLYDKIVLPKINRLAEIIDNNTLVRTDTTIINSKGQKEYSFGRNSYISLVFDTIKYGTEEQLRAIAEDLFSNPTTKYSNFVGSGENTSIDSIMRKLKMLDINEYGATKELGKTGVVYDDTKPIDFINDLIIHYTQNITRFNESETVTRTPSIILSDSPKLLFYVHEKLNMISNTNYKISKENGALHVKFNYSDNNVSRAIKNMIAIELSNMIEARDTLFERDDKGMYVLKSTLTEDDILNDYHKDTKGNVFVDGKAVGNVFKFHNFPLLNEIEDLFDVQGMPNITIEDLFTKGRILTSDELDTASAKINNIVKNIEDKINETLTNDINAFYDILKTNKDRIINKVTDTNYNNPSKQKEALYNFAVQYVVNTKMSYVDQQYLFNGTTAEYKGKTAEALSAATNKRGKAIISPFEVGAVEGLTEDFKLMILSDIEVDASESIKAVIKDLPKNQQADILGFYKNINKADAQGYITEHGMANWLKSHGQFYKYKNLFTKDNNNRYKLKDNLSYREISDIVTVVKPFYYNRRYDSKLNTHISTNIKTSLVLLSNNMIKGTQLETLADYMNNNNIEMAIHESGFKSGLRNVSNIYNEDGTIKTNTNKQLDIKPDNTITVSRKHFGNQVEIANHHKDTQIKASIQLFKLMTSNLIKANLYNGVNGLELENQYYSLLSSIIKDRGVELLQNLQTVYNDTKIRDLLIELAGKTITKSELAQLEIQDNKFKIPLDMSNGYRWQSLLNSLFSKKVTALKHPGLHNVMVSNSMLLSKSNTDISTSNYINGKPLTHYIDKESGLDVYEAYITPWSKDFYKADGTLKDIKDIDNELLNMLTYRIPLGSKASAFIVKVVGFVPEEVGSSIIVADEIIARTGADFDIDSLFMYRKQHVLKEDGTLGVLNDNSVDGRFNEILDIFMEILSSKHHTFEVNSPAEFEEPYKLSQDINNKLNDKILDNPTSIITQLAYKEMGLIAKKLIGIFGNNNTALTTLQRVGAHTNHNIPITYTKKYLKNKGISIKSLEEKFGIDNVINNKDTVDIINNNIFFNTDGTITTIYGTPYTTDYAKFINYVVDAVKFNLPSNLNEYTADLVTAMSLHGDMTYTIYMLQQNAVTEINKNIADSIFEESNNSLYAIHKTKSNFIKDILRIVDKDKSLHFELSQYIDNNKKYLSKILKHDYNLNARTITKIHNIINDNRELTIEQLKANINTQAKKDTLSPKAKLNYISSQLTVLNKIEEYKQLGKLLTKYALQLSFDKTGTGKSVNENINKIDTVQAIIAREQQSMPDNNDIIRDSYGEGVLTDIYKEDSTYPPLYNYYKYSNINGMEYTTSIFKIHLNNPMFSRAFNDSINNLQIYTTVEKENIAKQLNKYFKYRALTDFSKSNSLFNTPIEQIQTILGRNVKVNLDENISLNDFKQLSLANQIQIAKNKMNLVYNKPHILNYLNPLLAPAYIAKTNMHGIKVTDLLTDIDTLDLVKESFLEMYNSPNAYLREIAQNIVLYNLHTNGLTITGNSFSYMIHDSIYNKDEAFETHYQLDRLLQQDENYITDDFELLMIDKAPKLALTIDSETEGINTKTSFGFENSNNEFEVGSAKYKSLPNIIENALYVQVYNPISKTNTVYMKTERTETIKDKRVIFVNYVSTDIQINKRTLIVDDSIIPRKEENNNYEDAQQLDEVYYDNEDDGINDALEPEINEDFAILSANETKVPNTNKNTVNIIMSRYLSTTKC